MKRIVAASALALVIGFPLAASAEGEGRQPAGGAFMSSYSQATAPQAAVVPQLFRVPTQYGALRDTSVHVGKHPRR